MGTFHIEGWDFQWITGAADDPEDLCLHGSVRVHIGDTVLEDVGTVSATALYLLKSLTEDHKMNAEDVQMIPCCGHFLIANEDLSQVTAPTAVPNCSAQILNLPVSPESPPAASLFSGSYPQPC